MKTRRSWLEDPVVDAVRARVRLTVAIALIALLAATLFGSTLAALLHPLTAALARLPH